MKAGIIESPGVLKLTNLKEPVIENEDDVIVKIKRAGICGTDIHILHGTNPFASYPRIWGHEFTGEVIETGKAVTNTAAGDRVVIEPVLSCGECYACRNGRNNVCVSLRVLGVHTDGGCREYVCISAKNLHKLPGNISWDEAVLIEPFTIGAQTCMRGDVKENDIVLILGAGPIGLTVLSMVKLHGATAVITDIVNEKLEYALETGADYIINAQSENVAGKVMEITGGMGANVTVDAVCTAKSFEEAVLITSAAGRVVELGFVNEISGIAAVNVTKKELTICGSRLQTGRFPVVIDLMSQGKLKTDGFITASYPLAEMSEAFSFIERSGGRARKVIINIDD